MCLGKSQIRLCSPSSLICVFAEEALGAWLAYSDWKRLWQDCTEVQADLSFYWAYICCLCWLAARALHFSHFSGGGWGGKGKIILPHWWLLHVLHLAHTLLLMSISSKCWCCDINIVSQTNNLNGPESRAILGYNSGYFYIKTIKYANDFFYYGSVNDTWII